MYTGSGTNAELGGMSRIDSYKPDSTSLPRFVKQAFADEYTLSHRGVLAWMPIPKTALVPRVRGRILALEATFTVLLHNCRPAITNMYYSHLLIWQRDQVKYGPLCSHLSFREAIRGGLDLTPKELAISAAVRRERSAERAPFEEPETSSEGARGRS